MRSKHPRVFPVVWAVAVAAAASAAACSRPGSRGEVSTAPAVSTTDPREVVAEVDGKPITRAELDKKAADPLAALRQQEYDVLRQALEDMVAERLLEKEAAARHLSKEALLKAEVEDRVPATDPARLEAVYEQNKQRFGGKTREQMAPDIERAVRRQDVNARRRAFAEELRSKANVKLILEPPRAQVAIPAGSPILGPEKAPVTIVEFSDYQCPYCHRAQTVVDEIVQKYQGKVRLVHRDFPLDGHPRAMPAARAAHCADDQGKFWDYHRGLLTAPGDFSDQDFRNRAAGLGLDTSKFGKCLDSPRHDELIKASVEDGARIGVTGTPAFFINGRMLVGARPIEQFQEVIDAELAAAR
jgi:protein-disulfide isomerase